MKLQYLIIAIVVLSACSIFKGKTKTEQLIIKGQESLTNVIPNIEGFNRDKNFDYVLEVAKTKLAKEDRAESEMKYKYSLVNVAKKSPSLMEEGIYAYIQTSLGDIVGKLYMDRAPLTVSNFVGLAEGTIENTFRPIGEPYFDSLIFHRVIPNFMIQGGDPQGQGSGGPGYAFKNETHPELKHNKPGIFSMANSGPNTNGSQFFITHGPTPHLDGSYNVFGETVIGQEVVTKIGNTPRSRRNNRPNTPVYITHVEIIRVGEAAQKFDAAAVFNKLK